MARRYPAGHAGTKPEADAVALTMDLPLSVLDLAAVHDGVTVRETLEASAAAAGHAERLGFRRIWFAEHHNMPRITSSATSVLIGYVAGRTSSIRLGAGGVMLPNHAPWS